LAMGPMRAESRLIWKLLPKGGNACRFDGGFL
jgi:hypothetical protein